MYAHIETSLVQTFASNSPYLILRAQRALKGNMRLSFVVFLLAFGTSGGMKGTEERSNSAQALSDTAIHEFAQDCEAINDETPDEEPVEEPAAEEPAAVVYDGCTNDDSVGDEYDDTCSEWYDTNPDTCGDYDTETFVAADLCCA